jgi:hypothetical protein
MDRTTLVPEDSTWVRTKRWLRRIYHLGGITALLWSFSIWLTVKVLGGSLPQVRAITPGDIETLLFGASSVALIIYSVVNGLIGFVGYDHLKKDTADTVQATTRKNIDNLEKELRERIGNLEKEVRGRVSTAIGLTLGIINATPEERTEEERRGYLSESVMHSANAYQDLKEIKSKTQYTALNNLVYYSCALGRPHEKELLLERAEELRKFSEKNRPEIYLEGLLTYCRAIQDLSDDPAQIERAYRLAYGLSSEALNERQKKEAAGYAAILLRKLNQKTDS